MMICLLLIVSTVLLFRDSCYCDVTEPQVKTKWATIRGVIENVGPRAVNCFLGIPYAKPPVGELRFRKPQPLNKSYRGIFHAHKLPRNCPQPSGSISESSEDCLYLNVWYAQSESSSLRPVMLFIHGGAFEMGGSAKRKYYGSYLAAKGNVILVSINYRLGAFGFLFGNDEHEAPGNVALFDQRMAMAWVKENIRAFGGDPDRITLFGQSAGSMSIGLHLIVDESRALFERVIMMSGVPVDDVVMESPEIGLSKSRKLAEILGCQQNENFTTSDKLTKSELTCLRRIPAEKILEYQGNPQVVALGYNCGLIPFNPIYGSEFLAYSTNKLMEIGHFKKNISIMIGNVLNEGSVIDGIWQTSHVNTTTDALKVLEHYKPRAMSPSVGDNLAAFFKIYFADTEHPRISYLSLLSDLFFHCPTLIYAKKLAEFNKVNFYYFTYRSENSQNQYGPNHGEDVDYLFGLPFQEEHKYNEDDRSVSREMIRIWSDFTRNETLFWPEIIHTKIGVVFPIQYEINPYVKPPKIHPDPSYDKCQFWARVASIGW
ncbi:cholinesterase-like [Brevipalpus obovatus]|uniref:cholinesterase-like n=1 Tax=Brevipalpus obovatus TaxID=246614 RepID=UPI003D9F62BA